MLESMGLRAAAEQLVKTYSGGMIGKLEIACAMLIRPKTLFLDEPTLGLDPSARLAVWEKPTSFKEEFGTTVFFSTHYMDKANAYSDEAAFINLGRMVTSGTAEELKHTHFRASLLNSACPITASMSLLWIGYEVWRA